MSLFAGICTGSGYAEPAPFLAPDMAITDASVLASLSFVGSAAFTTSGSSQVQRIAEAFTASFTYGTGTNQINAVYADARTATTSPATFDLNSGTRLTDVQGNSITFTSIKGIALVVPTNVAGSSLYVSGGFVFNAVGDTLLSVSGSASIVVRSGGWWGISNPTGWPCNTAAKDQVSYQTISGTIDWYLLLYGVTP